MILKEAILHLKQMKRDAHGYTCCEKDVEALDIAIRSLEMECVRMWSLLPKVSLVLVNNVVAENLSEAMAEHLMDEIEARMEAHLRDDEDDEQNDNN